MVKVGTTQSLYLPAVSSLVIITSQSNSNSSSNIWKRYFKLLSAINCGKGWDKMQNISWRCENLPSSPHLQNVVIMCGTNNTHHTSAEDIVDGIVEIALSLRRKYHPIAIFPPISTLVIITSQSAEFI